MPGTDFPAPPNDGREEVDFGPFRLLPGRRMLLRGSMPVRLGSRALDILLTLVARRGELVSKRELMEAVWPDTHVVEANLTVHVTALRRALGDAPDGSHYIVNEPGRGYRFVAPVKQNEIARAERRDAILTNLPANLTHLVGRDDALVELRRLLGKHRLVSIVGPGGIGKTSVALALAELSMESFTDGAWLVDFASVTDSGLVATGIASALDIEMRGDEILGALLATLRTKSLLLVFDNCEHLVDEIARIAVHLVRNARNIKILATSREPLRVDGEHVYRLGPLPVPPPALSVDAATAISYPAVQLFVERAGAIVNDFKLLDEEANAVANICRQLDGMPLAIEFAAARIDTLGLGGLVARLGDRLRLLTNNAREPVPRHKTIITALDWSFQLLTEREKRLFLYLSIFVGGFTLEAAQAIAAEAGEDKSAIADDIAGLVVKSLVTADIGNIEVRFRLLETIRVYALEKLGLADASHDVRVRHARYFATSLEQAAIEQPNELAIRFANELDNIRSALGFAFQNSDTVAVGVELAAAAAPLLFARSLLTECHHWCARALAAAEAGTLGQSQELVLQSLLGLSLMFTSGMSEQAQNALSRANELAGSQKNIAYQLQVLAGLALFSIRVERFGDAVMLGRRAEMIARHSNSPALLSLSDYILCCGLYFECKFVEAFSYAKRCVDTAGPEIRQAHIAVSGIDHSIQARCVMAGVQWQQGLFDQAMRACEGIFSDAQSSGHSVSVCFALVWGVCPISLRLGLIERAEAAISLLRMQTRTDALDSYYACALGFEGQIAAHRGDLPTAERLLRESLDGLKRSKYEVLCTPFLAALASVTTQLGRVDEGLSAIEEAVRRTERNHAFWWRHEALRLKGELVVKADSSNAAEAERLFLSSIALAREHRTLAWELRSTVSLGRLYAGAGRLDEAHAVLSAVYERFTEGYDSDDLVRARQYLAKWGKGQRGVDVLIEAPVSRQ